MTCNENNEESEDIEYCDNCGIVLTSPYICRSCGHKTCLCDEDEI